MLARVCGAAWIAAAMVPRIALAGAPAADAAAAELAAGDVPAVADAPTVPVRADRADQADQADPGSSSAVPPPPASPAGAAAAPRFHWEPFGFLRLQYIAVQDDPNVAFVGRDDGFELQNARIGVRGEIDERIAFVVAFDGAIDEREQVNNPNGKLGVGLRDAFADVALGALGDRLVARGGFFQAWVDPEALVPDTERELVDNPIESRGMRATEGYQTPGLPPGRSLGAAIRLEPGPPGAVSAVGIGAELAVQNGADEFSSNNDNDKPAVSATLFARLPRDSWLMAAVRYNPRTVGDLPFRQDENDLQATAGLRLVLGPIALGGALIVQRTTYPTTGGPLQNAFGGHGQVMLALPVSLPVAVGYRFGILDPSSLITTDRVMEHSAALVMSLPRYRVRLQLELTHVVEQPSRELQNDRAQLAAELSL